MQESSIRHQGKSSGGHPSSAPGTLSVDVTLSSIRVSSPHASAISYNSGAKPARSVLGP